MNPALTPRATALQRDLDATKRRIQEDLLKFAPSSTATAVVTLGKIMLLKMEWDEQLAEYQAARAGLVPLSTLEEIEILPSKLPKGIIHDLDELEAKMRQPVAPHAAMNADAVRLLMVVVNKLVRSMIASGDWREEE